ncbi:hypothetical protein IE077_003262 [Cardiosporidium cionae]|uniref:Cyclin-dependent kinases regulatory subunit n=1 Tax=Cardiosporidium cionae TaxID=476202 RepID=A0ABQ7J9N1_9APIC|nr:hypothetical protein IE077_003262 [Cardiosporidium cionae]|eukprot:KAF8820360.1 hypothetical protein IE077_003262 [Cardiosporidium cionae]
MDKAPSATILTKQSVDEHSSTASTESNSFFDFRTTLSSRGLVYLPPSTTAISSKLKDVDRLNSEETEIINSYGVALWYGPKSVHHPEYDFRIITWGLPAYATTSGNKRLEIKFREKIRALAAQNGDGLLTFRQLYFDLDIRMSAGWEHYAAVELLDKRDRFSEFLLRRKKVTPSTTCE